MKRFPLLILMMGLLVLPTSTLCGQDKVGFSRQGEVIYGRKHGLAMTMDIFSPSTGANGVGVIAAVSGGWFSGQATIASADGQLPGFFKKQIGELLGRGYTVFAVVHGSQSTRFPRSLRICTGRSVTSVIMRQPTG